MAREKAPLWDRPTYVYRIYDRDGGLLYVGISENQWTRIEGGHKKSAAWFTAAVNARIELYGNRYQAIAVESWAIKYELPIHNYEPGTRYLPDDADHVPKPTQSFERKMYQRIRWSND